MTKKYLIILALMLNTSITIFAQTKNIAVLPFFGGSGKEGDTISNMIGMELDEVDAIYNYSIIQRGKMEQVLQEQKFQRKGLTDENTIAQIGQGANAHYIVTGNIEKLGRQNYIVVSMIEVESLRQTAGAYYVYEDLSEIVEYLPTIAKNLINITESINPDAKTLAILPFDIDAIKGGTNIKAAELLAQILSCEIANTCEYAVVIRTAFVEKVMSEQKIQRSHLSSDQNLQKLGAGINATYVLTGEIGLVGSANFMLANIIHVETFVQKASSRERYTDRTDGVQLMSALSYKLTNKISQIKLNDFLKKLNVYRRNGTMSINEMNTIKTLISNGNINAKNDFGYTSLMLTSAWNDTRIDIVRDIIYLGADVNAVSNDGTTALMYAAANGFSENVKVLLENGADINAENNNGDTALYLAKEYGRTYTIRILEEAGAYE